MTKTNKGADNMKIRITQGNGWYSNKVGEVYEVVSAEDVSTDEIEDSYFVNHPENSRSTTHFVDKVDCEVLDEKLHVIDGVEYVEVDRKARVGDKVVIINTDDEGYGGTYFRVGNIATVLHTRKSDIKADFSGNDFKLDAGIWHVSHSEYRVLEPISAQKSPQSQDDIIANLVRRVAELERYTYEAPVLSTDEIDEAIAEVASSNENIEYDVVSRPQHYNIGKYEVIDVIEDAVSDCKDGFEAACIANVLKYTMRYRHKNGVTDLRKAAWYLDRVIARLDD